jgi:hypothetical protein
LSPNLLSSQNVKLSHLFYRSMPQSSVDTEYRIHRVQNTPSTAYTEYNTHQIQHITKVEWSLSTRHAIDQLLRSSRPNTQYCGLQVHLQTRTIMASKFP